MGNDGRQASAKPAKLKQDRPVNEWIQTES